MPKTNYKIRELIKGLNMRKIILFITIVFIGLQYLVAQADQKKNINKQTRNVDYPWVPRITPEKAYMLYKSKKTIILHAGGEKYDRRHIVGAIKVPEPKSGSAYKNKKIPKLPRKGIYILTYCY